MKVLRFLAKTVLVLLLAVVVVGLFLSPEWECERTIVVNADAGQIHPLVADLRRWDEWSAWNSKIDPTMELTFSGAESGAGAVEEWTSQDMGTGRLEITAASPEGVEYFLAFEDMPHKIYGSFEFAPSGENTEIIWKSWGATGKMPWDKVLSQAFVPLIGGHLETGLSGLKAMVEGNPN